MRNYILLYISIGVAGASFVPVGQGEHIQYSQQQHSSSSSAFSGHDCIRSAHIVTPSPSPPSPIASEVPDFDTLTELYHVYEETGVPLQEKLVQDPGMAPVL
eukprot:gene905-259_t